MIGLAVCLLVTPGLQGRAASSERPMVEGPRLVRLSRTEPHHYLVTAFAALAHNKSAEEVGFVEISNGPGGGRAEVVYPKRGKGPLEVQVILGGWGTSLNSRTSHNYGHLVEAALGKGRVVISAEVGSTVDLDLIRRSEQSAELIFAVLNNRRLKGVVDAEVPIDVTGHSYGGAGAMRLWGDHPDLFMKNGMPGRVLAYTPGTLGIAAPDISTRPDILDAKIAEMAPGAQPLHVVTSPEVIRAWLDAVTPGKDTRYVNPLKDLVQAVADVSDVLARDARTLSREANQIPRLQVEQSRIDFVTPRKVFADPMVEKIRKLEGTLSQELGYPVALVQYDITNRATHQGYAQHTANALTRVPLLTLSPGQQTKLAADRLEEFIDTSRKLRAVSQQSAAASGEAAAGDGTLMP